MTAGSGGPADDWLEALVADHRALERSFDELAGAVDASDAKRRLIQMRKEISRHADAEAAALSFLGPRLGGGRERWRSWRHAYRSVERLLALIDRRSISSPDLAELIDRVVADVEQLIDDQETCTFPLLRSSLTNAEQAQLARRVAAAQRHGTTWPHPHLLHRGLLSRAVRAGLAPVDHLRDRMAPRL